jgi:hypothetical protein
MAGYLRFDNIRNSAGNVVLPTYTLKRRMVQRISMMWRGGLWNPGNNYQEIPGSMISITPFYDNSRLVYTYMCPLGHRGAAHSITHWIFMVNGQEYARHNRSVDHQESGHVMRWEVPSWGTDRAGSIGYMTRQYGDSTHSVHFNGRRYLDGGDNSQGVPAQVTVEEIVPSYYNGNF